MTKYLVEKASQGLYEHHCAFRDRRFRSPPPPPNPPVTSLLPLTCEMALSPARFIAVIPFLYF